MQNPLRTRDHPDPRSFAARKGHLSQLSISDESHHVTEAIGYMYGDDDSPTSPQSQMRPSIRPPRLVAVEESEGIGGRNPATRKATTEDGTGRPDRVRPVGEPEHPSSIANRNGWEKRNGVLPMSAPDARESSPTETANTQFPLNDIDYESSPVAVAQELSNLQALRRMSMDVGAAGDPDLPQLNAAAMPRAPSPATSEDDSARLFWVPARLHPELAPKEFKTFLESKAEQIKRRSGELSAFSSLSRTSSSSSLSVEEGDPGLRRKKSMLSRQIETSNGYQDGADRLEKKRSEEQHNHHISDPKLQELESIVSGGAAVSRPSLDSKSDDAADDMILPSIPGSSLKRSTRTKYQKPNSRKAVVDRSTLAERARRKAAAGESSEAKSTTPAAASGSSDASLSNFSTDVSNLALTLKDPSSEPHRVRMNFSRPGTRSPSPPPGDSLPQPRQSIEAIAVNGQNGMSSSEPSFQKRSQRGAAPPVGSVVPDRQIPQIVESPPPPEDHPVRTSSMAPLRSTNAHATKSEMSPSDQATQRESRSKTAPSPRPAMPPKPTSPVVPHNRPSPRGSNMPPQTPPSQSLDQPSPLPGHDTNTSNLSFIPTLTVDKRQEQKRKEEKKSGWGWLKGREEPDKEKDKSKGRGTKPTQSHDSTRLDVLQTSIDSGPKGRESLVLDRESLRLEEERRKESQRKASGTEKKEKESLFSSFFGGKKSKAEKEAQRKAQERLSPEPPHRELRPDIDYNWTRFSILEERAIYRMAHIKLANPRRALYSQVLLSNFMYSYLAKVQQMHPQMNLPTSAKQQRKQREQQQSQQLQQPDEFTQYQRYQQQQAQQAQQASASPGGATGSQPPRPSADGSDPLTFDFNYSRNPSRPETSGSVESSSFSEGGDPYSSGHGTSHAVTSHAGAAGPSPYEQQQQPPPPSHLSFAQRQQHYQSRSGHGYNDDDDDDDDDMW